MSNYPVMSREQVDALEAELTQIKNEAMADLGERDANYIRRIIRIQQGAEVAGRGLLMFGFTPVSWALGTAALSVSKILENMEIGHNVMHGQYDWMNDPKLNGNTYDWDNVCTGDNWRHYHNYEHHTYTNILGKDRDVGYGILRVAEDQHWRPKHLFQPLSYAALAALFQWGVGVHDQDPARKLNSKQGRKELKTSMKPFYRKVRKQLFKDYVFFPVIALWNAPRVFAGNLVANLIRNIWSNVVIFCGHFPDGTRTFTLEETKNETRGDWYLRQMHGSANFEGSRLMHIMSGHLSHQIEHHLFPDLPAHRYPEIAPKVRAVCEKYGVPYNTGSLLKQYGTVLKNLFRFSLPTRQNTALSAA
ncbi:MAG: fatty acid desaturase family protein [Panacagrimonas sp.]